MKPIGWFAGILVAVVVGFASACGSTTDGGDTQTNWLKGCTDSSECGGLECICGYCAKGCTVTLDCNGTPVVTSCHDPASIGAVNLCGAVSPPTGVCLASCNADTECASSERCFGGVCMPLGSLGTEAGAAPEVQMFCERWVEARCSYVESCGCGAAAAVQCRTEYLTYCGPGGFFAGVSSSVATGGVLYDAAAADALLARFEAADPLCVEENFRIMRLTSDELYSWAGVFVGTREIGEPCNLPVTYKGGISDCREGACAARASGNICIALVGLGETCDGSGDESFDTATELCFDERPSDSDGEYESAFDSLSCVPDAPGSSALVCSRGLADGQNCHNEEACSSGRCESVDAETAVCSPQLVSGETCTSPQDCVSGVCDFSVMPAVCGTQSADGEACSFDGDCVNGRCLRPSSAPLGVCGLGLADGETCTADIECASEVCRMGTCFADICADYLSL